MKSHKKSKKKKRKKKKAQPNLIDRIDLNSLVLVEEPEPFDFDPQSLTEELLDELLEIKNLAYEPEFKSFYFNPIEVFRLLREELRKDKSLGAIDNAQKAEEILERLTVPIGARVLNDNVLDKILSKLEKIINRAESSNNLKLFTLADLYADVINEAKPIEEIANLEFVRALVLKTIMASLKLNRVLIDSFNIAGMDGVDTLDSEAILKIDRMFENEFPDIGSFILDEIKAAAIPKLLQALKDSTLKTQIFTAKEVERGYAMLKEERKKIHGKASKKSKDWKTEALKILNRFLEIVFTEGRIKKLAYVARNYMNDPEYRKWKEGFESLIETNIIGGKMEADLETLARIYYYEIRNAYPKNKMFQE